VSLLLFTGFGSSETILPGVQFYDEVFVYDINSNMLASACNPLPAGILVSFYGGNTVSPATYSGITGYVTINGIVDVTLQANQLYTAVFFGDQAPTVYGQFTTDIAGNATNGSLQYGAPGAPCSVIGYRSPSLSSLGYAIEQTNLWPSSWFSSSAMLIGGNAFPVAAGFGNILGLLDYNTQAILSILRLQTLLGANYFLNTEFSNNALYVTNGSIQETMYSSSAINSWAYDFFGNLWVRQTGMTDAQWITLIQTTLQTPKTTLAGIQQILTAWSPWFSSAVSPGASQALGFDEYGGMDVAIPPAPNATVTYTDTTPGAHGLAGRNIIVFDATLGAFPNPVSNHPPILASSATLNSYLPDPLVPGQIAVYFQNPQNADSGLVPVSITNTLLNTLVSNWKAAGVGYISSGVQYPCLYCEN